jgi:hypothetical protein
LSYSCADGESSRMRTFLLTDDVEDLYVPEGDKRRI